MIGRIAIRSVAMIIVGLSFATYLTAGDDKKANALDIVMGLESDAEYGAYLANECLTCHSADGPNGAIPQLHGKEKAYLASAMLAFKFEQRQNEVMRSIAKNLSNEDIAALATYFSVE